MIRGLKPLQLNLTLKFYKRENKNENFYPSNKNLIQLDVEFNWKLMGLKKQLNLN